MLGCRAVFPPGCGGGGGGVAAGGGAPPLADRRRLVCVVGDGSALYSVQALWSAARYGAPVTYVLLDNGGYAAVRALGRRIGVEPVPGTDIGGIDFAALAESFGCPATRAEHPDELPAALDHALGRGDDAGPFLLQVQVAGSAGTLYEPWAE
ncbi:thiamine pyrophosphate-dependent enzyme [Streptomyces diastatochromogenes]|uniref:thiamine pyrophosphate-dependent enzyme n=1 Tax=Streptomyces diastatochromogenes TaxID=42236 RepID=UPI003688CDF2